MRRTLWLLPLIALLLSACSNRPNDEAIRQQVSAHLQADGGELLFDVLNLHKLEGIQRSDYRYEVEVEYHLKFKVGLEEAAKQMQAEGANPLVAGFGAMTLAMEYGDFKKGQMLYQRRRFTFVKADSGWVIETRR